MACFELKINNRMYKLPTNGSNDLDSLVQAAIHFKSENPKGFELFCQDLMQNKEKPDSLELKPLSKREQRDFLPALQDNLQKAGITLHIDENEFQDAIQKNNLNPDAKSFVLNGEIYIDPTNFDITDAFHEISHLFFAVLKIQNREKYTQLLDTLLKNPVIKEIFKNLPNVYKKSDLGFEADTKEEAVMRYIELVLSNKLNEEEMEVGGDSIDIIDEVLSPVIMQIFGIEKENYPGFVSFMNSFITDITTFGGMVTMRPKLDSVGFIDYKNQAIKSAAVSEYLQDLADRKIIQKGECQ